MRGRGVGARAAALVVALLGPACGFDERLATGDRLASGAGGDGGAGGAAGAAEGNGAAGAGGAACAAPSARCGGACVDVQTDAANCGTCGYACGVGSSCAAGECAPVAVATGVVAPYALAADEAHVYWATAAADANGAPLPVAFRAARAGGAPEPLFDGRTGRARALGRRGTTLYLGLLDATGPLLKGDVGGGVAATHVAGQAGLQHLAVAGEEVVWSTFDGAASRVRRARAAGAVAPGEVVELASSPQPGRAAWVAAEGAVGGATAFWVTGGNAPGAARGLWRRGPGEGAPAQLLTSASTLAQVALGGEGGAYVATGTEGVWRAEGAGGALQGPTVTVPPSLVPGSLVGLAATATHLYWLAFGRGELVVYRGGLDGSDARVLGRVAAVSAGTYQARSLGPAYVVVEGDSVYFSDPGTLAGEAGATNDPRLEGVRGAADGAIYRLPR